MRGKRRRAPGRSPEGRKGAKVLAAAEAPAPGPEPAAGAPAPAPARTSPNWAGLPTGVLALVAARLAADADRAAAFLPREKLRYSWDGEESSECILNGHQSYWRDDRGGKPDQQRDGLLAFAMACKPFRAAQVQLGGQLRTRIGGLMRHEREDVGLGLVLWAVREAGCPTVEATPKWSFGPSCTPMTLTAVAALWGNLPALKRLHEEGFEWNEQTPAAAAETGQLDVLQVPSVAGIEGRGSRLTDASRFTLTVASSRHPPLSALPLG